MVGWANVIQTTFIDRSKFCSAVTVLCTFLCSLAFNFEYVQTTLNGRWFMGPNGRLEAAFSVNICLYIWAGVQIHETFR